LSLEGAKRLRALERDSVIKVVCDILEPHHDVLLAYLFGSVARKGVSLHDLDLALLLRGDDKLSIMGDILMALSRALGVDEEKVNVVDLERADLHLKYRVLKEGVKVIDRWRYEELIRSEVNLRYPDLHTLESLSLREWFESGDPSTLDPIIVKRRLDFAKNEANFLECEVLSKPKDQVVASRVLRSLLERSVQLITEAIIDICRHVISAEGWGPAASYSEYLELMATHEVISLEFAKTFGRYVTWRNILVHRYLEIDHGRLLDDAAVLVKALRDFERAIRRFIARQPPAQHTS